MKVFRNNLFERRYLENACLNDGILKLLVRVRVFGNYLKLVKDHIRKRIVSMAVFSNCLFERCFMETICLNYDISKLLVLMIVFGNNLLNKPFFETTLSYLSIWKRLA